MIDEAEIEKALDFIRDNAGAAAKAKAERVYLTEYRKSLKADLMKQSNASAVNAREEYAYSHKDYKEFLEGIKAAVFEDERLRFLILAAQAKIDAWRTQEATMRGGFK